MAIDRSKGLLETRAGRFIPQPGGYRVFEPAPLPPFPPLSFDASFLRLLSQADLALGELAGVVRQLPNPDLFVAMYVRQEAVLSSQIEGTQASLTDVLQFEAGDGSEEQERLLDVHEVVNYVDAMNHGIAMLNELPLSLRLIKDIHARLMVGVRGENKSPGEFRRIQVHIGPTDTSLLNATFVPPSPDMLGDALHRFETFLHDRELPDLVHAGLCHAQFETIHPFYDGNGRMGRLLITFLLCERQVLSRPLLYLSHFLKLHRAEYYDRLQAVRVDGNWEGWLAFFLRGVREVAREATDTASNILALRERYRDSLSKKRSPNLVRAFDLLFSVPMLTAKVLQDRIGVSAMTAFKILDQFVELGILQEITGFKRNRWFAFAPYLQLFDGRATEPTIEMPHDVTTTLETRR